MTLKRKLGIAAVLVAALTITLWPRPKGYTYQGKTVEEWFSELHNWRQREAVRCGYLTTPESLIAFQEMGPDAAPFLARLITRDLNLSPIANLISRLPGRSRAKPLTVEELSTAATLLAMSATPEKRLRELLKPALLSTNAERRTAARIALEVPSMTTRAPSPRWSPE